MELDILDEESITVQRRQPVRRPRQPELGQGQGRVRRRRRRTVLDDPPELGKETLRHWFQVVMLYSLFLCIFILYYADANDLVLLCHL